MATTEGGGAALFVDGTGTVRFVDRRFRKPGAAVMTIDAVQDLDGSVYNPAFDDSTLINAESVDRAAESGTLSTQTYSDPTSQGTYGVLADQATTYTSTDQDAVALAQSTCVPSRRGVPVAAGRREPHGRGEQPVCAARCRADRSRIRVANLPAKAARQRNLIFMLRAGPRPVNGRYRVVFDASPADNPPKMILDDAAYGRLAV